MRKPPSLTKAAEFPVTTALVVLAIAVSAAGFMHRDTSVLVMDVRAFRGEPWRVFTSVLPHVNLLHIAFNVLWLWTFGAAIEKRFGSVAMLAISLVLAAGSTLAEYALFGTGVGLSGIGYGLFGMLWVLSSRDADLADMMDSRTVQTFVIWFAACVIFTATGYWRVANVAHGIGAVFGAVLAFAIAQPGARRTGWSLLAAALTGASLAGATKLRPRINRSRDVGIDSAQLAASAFTARRFTESIAYGTIAVRLNPRQADWWYNLGLAYARQSQLDAASDAFRRALQSTGGTADARGALAGISFQRGAAAFEQGRMDEAVRLYRDGLRIDDRQGFAWHNLAVALGRLNRGTEAVDAFRTALAREPTSASHRSGLSATLEDLGNTALDAGDLPTAQRWYRETLAVDDTDAIATHNLGVVYGRQGNRAEALEAFERAARLQPDNAEFRATAASLRELTCAPGAVSRPAICGD